MRHRFRKPQQVATVIKILIRLWSRRDGAEITNYCYGSGPRHSGQLKMYQLLDPEDCRTYIEYGS